MVCWCNNLWDVGKERGRRGRADEKMPQQVGICEPHCWDNHCLPAPQHEQAGRKGTKWLGWKSCNTVSSSRSLQQEKGMCFFIQHVGIALKDLLDEHILNWGKNKMRREKYIILRTPPLSFDYFCYPSPLFPEPRHNKVSPRLCSHFEMLPFISVVVHWVNEFNITTEIEWLLNRLLVVICWKRGEQRGSF